MSAARTPLEVRHDEQSALSGRRGAPWWAVMLFALLLTAVGAGIDLSRSGDLGVLFRVLYVVGCVVAVLAVSRRGLFAATVQPPLVLVVAVPVVAEVVGRAGRGGLRSTAIALALPLVNAFPTTAITTLVVLVLGGLRLVLQRRPRQAGLVEDDRDEGGGNAGGNPANGSRAAAGSWARGGASPSPRTGGDTTAGRPPRPDGAREPRRYGPSSGTAPGGRNGGRAVPPLPVNPNVPLAGRPQPAPGPRPDSWRPGYERPEYQRPEYQPPEYQRRAYQPPDAGHPDPSSR